MQNLDIVHSSSTIPGLFSTLGVATNQAGSPSVSPNNANTSEMSGEENAVTVAGGASGGGNAVAVESDIRNEGAREPKGGVDFAVRNEGTGAPKGDAKIGLEVQLKVDAKIGFEVQPITVVTALVSHWPATVIGTLASLVTVFVCRQPAPVYDTRPQLSQAQLPSCATHAESMTLSIKLFKDT